MSLSVIIPTFNELKNGYLENILENLTKVNNIEVIFVDSHSTDGTRDLIIKYGFKIIDAETNSRAIRQNIGIDAALNDLILLHHPRSLLDIKGIQYLIDNQDSLYWGGFTHCFDQKHNLLKFTSWYSNEIRGKIKEVLYLDHCIFFKKSLVKSHPIVPEVDIFEDTELSYNLQKSGSISILPFYSKTSAIRFQKNGVFKQALLNQFLKIGYFLNIPHEKMNALYEKGLSLNSKYKKTN